jgi:nicotinate-nucleotide pyrophosphorylase
MSKQILLGYKDREGQTPPVILCGPDAAPSDLAKIFNAADRGHVFPEGIARLERVNLDVVQTSIFISAEVTEHLKKLRDEEQSLIKTRAAAKAAETAQQKAVRETGAVLREATIHRNNLLGDKLKAEIRLRNLLATPVELQPKSHKSNVDAASKDLEELKNKVAVAVTEYQAAFEANAAAKNPKTETDKE